MRKLKKKNAPYYIKQDISINRKEIFLYSFSLKPIFFLSTLNFESTKIRYNAYDWHKISNITYVKPKHSDNGHGKWKFLATSNDYK